MEIQKTNFEKQVGAAVLKEQERLQRITKESDLIFIGTIVDVGNAPDGWSGYFSSYQTVRYKIDYIIKGQFGAEEISIDHIVVSGSKTAEIGETAKLSTGIFHPGASLIVSAVRGSKSWKSLNEVIGAVPNSADWLKRVEHLLPKMKQ